MLRMASTRISDDARRRSPIPDESRGAPDASSINFRSTSATSTSAKVRHFCPAYADSSLFSAEQRGGTVDLQPIAVPEMKFSRTDGTSDALYAMDLHLQQKKFVYKNLVALHDVAEDARDVQMQD